MKKIFLALLIIISINSFSQGLDTIRVRNLALRADEWYWLKAYWSPTGTIEKLAWKKMRTTLAAAAPSSNNTIVIIDSIPGSIALSFYNIFLRGSKGETGQMGQNISTNIKAYIPMLFFTSQVDAEYNSRFQNSRGNGKDDFEN